VRKIPKPDGFESLVLPEGHKEIVKALVQMHSQVSEERTIARDRKQLDLVRGKGGYPEGHGYFNMKATERLMPSRQRSIGVASWGAWRRENQHCGWVLTSRLIPTYIRLY